MVTLAVLVLPRSSAATPPVTILSEDFEHGWPENWTVSDDNMDNGFDYWGLTDYNSRGGHSLWCAQFGVSSVDGRANSDDHYYDQSMAANLEARLGDLKGYSSVTLSFDYWARTGSSILTDYLSVNAWDGSSWSQLWVQTAADSHGWQTATVDVPVTCTLLDFYFLSGKSMPSGGPYEGAYLDNVLITGVDNTPPTSSLDPLNPGYTSPVVNITYTASDEGGSGVDHVELYYRMAGGTTFLRYATPANPGGAWTDPIPFDVASAAGEGTYDLYLLATDKAGNQQAVPGPPYARTTVDSSPPTTQMTADGTAGTNGWYTSDVTVTLHSADNVSGVAGTWYSLNSGPFQSYTGPFTITAEGTNRIDYYATDGNGNTEPTRETTVQIDRYAPSTTANLFGAHESSGWYLTSVLVTLSASDPASGIAGSFYSIDSGPWSRYTGSVMVDQDGKHTFSFYSMDQAGNAEANATLVLWIDARPPQPDYTINGKVGTNGWFVSEVTVTLTPPTSTSGLRAMDYQLDSGDWTAYGGPVVLSTDGVHNIQVRASNNAGNVFQMNIPTIMIDQTPPTLSFSSDPVLTLHQNSTNVPCTCTDPVSGIDHIEVEVDGGPAQTFSADVASALLEQLSEGNHTITVRAVDRAGNVGQGELAFTAKAESPSGALLGGDITLALVVCVIVALALFLVVRYRPRPEAPNTVHRNKETLLYRVGGKDQGEASVRPAGPPAMKACPNCQRMNPTESMNCLSCGLELVKR